MHSLDTVKELVSQITYPTFKFEIGQDEWQPYLQISCNSFDTRTGDPFAWKGRKWRLSYHMTDGEIVQTALMAVLASLEHEARELFLYKGVSVFDPHYDIDKLVALRQE